MNSKYLFLLIIATCLYAHGSPWEYIGPDTVAFTAMHDWYKGTLIAAPHVKGQRSFFLTHDHGKTWDTLCTPTNMSNYVVDQFLFHNNVLYIVLPQSISSQSDVQREEQGDIYNFGYSLDSGKTWQSFEKFNEVRAWWVRAKDDILVVGCDGIVARSTDSGKTWTRHVVGGAQCYSADKYGDTLYCGTNSGLYVSHNWGESWVFRGAELACIYTLNFVGTILITGVQIGVRYHRNFGFGNSPTWTTTIGPEVGLISKAYPIKDSLVYAHYDADAGGGVIGSHLYYSTDSAKTFKRFWLHDDTTITPRVYRFHSDNTYAYALTYKGIYRRLIYDNTGTIQTTKQYKHSHNPIKIHNACIAVSALPGTKVTVSLYTLTGRIVQKIYSGVQHEAVNTYPIFSRSAAGVCVAVVKVGTSTFTQQVLSLY